MGTPPPYSCPRSAAHLSSHQTQVLPLGWGAGPIPGTQTGPPRPQISTPLPCSLTTLTVASVLVPRVVRSEAQVQEQGLGGEGGGGEHFQGLVPLVLVQIQGLLSGFMLWVSDSHMASAVGMATGKFSLFGVP